MRAVGDLAPSDGRITASALADLLAEFRQPGQPLHGLPEADAERVFVEVVEQLLLNAMRQKGARRSQN